MALRHHIDRWILASLSKHFIASKEGLNLIIEGQVILPSTAVDFSELRMTGPNYNRMTQREHRFDIIVNLLVNVIQQGTDAHKIYRHCGIFERACKPCIPVYKLGNGPEDHSATVFGYLEQLRNGTQLVETIHFGLISPETKVMQSTVETYYRLKYRGILD